MSKRFLGDEIDKNWRPVNEKTAQEGSRYKNFTYRRSIRFRPAGQRDKLTNYPVAAPGGQSAGILAIIKAETAYLSLRKS
ncbi:hypothetical protein JK621_17315 [Serratia plymuthica]|uniref:hypothetical protein n=1 Tax=Serratia plymuthica TaxID=82996 RepID=UPI001BAEE620|nr:hypothetical protein [Serratia plymuthica]QUY47164.1 hypothetical protein JK621_17315 [Serratia plymuthica]